MNFWTAPRRADVDRWAVTRLHDEPYHLPHMSNRPHIDAPILDPQHGTEGCADTSDEPADDFAFAKGMLLAVAVFAVLAAAGLVIWGTR
jgi:hypothetical protein